MEIFIFLSKIIPLIFLPLGLSIIFLLLGLKKRNFFLIKLSTFILLFFSNSFSANFLQNFIERPWKIQTPHKIKKADAIVVLSGGGITNYEPLKTKNWGDPDRFLAGINLYKNQKAPIIIFTGEKVTNQKTSGELYIEEALELGIPRGSLFKTGNVRNTLEESKKINLLLNTILSKKDKKIILITSAYHMSRALKLFEKKDLKVIPYPVDFEGSIIGFKNILTPRYLVPTSQNLNKSSIALREIMGRGFYNLYFFFKK